MAGTAADRCERAAAAGAFGSLAPPRRRRQCQGTTELGPGLRPLVEAEPRRRRRGILFRRSLGGPTDVAHYAVWTTEITPLIDVLRTVESRWSIEERVERAMSEVCLGHDEVRRFTRWYRHIPLTPSARALSTVDRAASDASSWSGGKAMTAVQRSPS